MKKKIILCICLAIVIIAIAVTYVLFNKNTETPNNTGDNVQKDIITTPSPSTTYQGISEQDKSIFNSNFDMYIGKKVKGIQVKSLIATIKSSNESSTLGKVVLAINGEESMDSSKIDKEKTYSVSFEYDEKGLICKAIVEEN